MFCPSCGLEERNSNQFCRACGTDLRSVRGALERPDNITSSAASARNEIGRAVAAKIREFDSARDLARVAEDVLPQIEKFLESPAERRLRRIRTGTLISLIGMGATIAFTLIGLLADAKFLPVIAPAMVTLFIGLSFVINGLLFTVPKKEISDNVFDANSQRELDAQTNELILPKSNQTFSSVTEQTTRHLQDKELIPRG